MILCRRIVLKKFNFLKRPLITPFNISKNRNLKNVFTIVVHIP